MSSFFDKLGIDPEFFGWKDLSLCRYVDTEYFFSWYEEDPEIAKAVDAMCSSCPVQQECFIEGQSGEYGLWGAVFWNGSGKPDMNKNSHKEPGELAMLLSKFNES